MKRQRCPKTYRPTSKSPTSVIVRTLHITDWHHTKNKIRCLNMVRLITCLVRLIYLSRLVKRMVSRCIDVTSQHDFSRHRRQCISGQGVYGQSAEHLPKSAASNQHEHDNDVQTTEQNNWTMLRGCQQWPLLRRPQPQLQIKFLAESIVGQYRPLPVYCDEINLWRSETEYLPDAIQLHHYWSCRQASASPFRVT